MTTDVVPRSTRKLRRAMWGLLFALIVAIGAWTYVTLTARFRVIADIQAAGGQCAGPGLLAFLELPFTRLAGQKTRTGAHVALLGPGFDDAWLADHDDLRAVTAAQLAIRDTRLSREAVMRILVHQNPTVLDPAGDSADGRRCRSLGQPA